MFEVRETIQVLEIWNVFLLGFYNRVGADSTHIIEVEPFVF